MTYVKPWVKFIINEVDAAYFSGLNSVVKENSKYVGITKIAADYEEDKQLYKNIELLLNPSKEEIFPRVLYNDVVGLVKGIHEYDSFRLVIEYMTSEELGKLNELISKYKDDRGSPLPISIVGNIHACNEKPIIVAYPKEDIISTSGQIFERVPIILSKEAQDGSYRELTDLIYNIMEKKDIKKR